MLNIKTRQSYLKSLGFYDGEVDGLDGPLTKEAVLKLQKKYFKKKSDIDGLYGVNTDKLLVSAKRVQLYCKNFVLQEFKCGCDNKYCTGYPAYISKDLLINIQKLRDEFEMPMNISSGLRCSKYNSMLVGSIPNSKHTQGKAIDFFGPSTATKTHRQRIIKQWGKYKKASYAYSDTPNMGTSVHVDVE